MHSYGTRGKDIYQTKRNRTVVTGMIVALSGNSSICQQIPNVIRSAFTPNPFETRMQIVLSSEAFGSRAELTAHNRDSNNGPTGSEQEWKSSEQIWNE